MGKAWLIGLYTIEIDARIEELGYTLTHVFAIPEAIDSCSNLPDIIVFVEDGVSTLTSMEMLRHVFPGVVMISVPLPNAFIESCQSFSDRRASDHSVGRLLHQIYEREHRWDN